MTELQDLQVTTDSPNWCPGCGDFGIWTALKRAIVELNLNPWEVVLVSGIGCSSKLPYWVKTYGFNGLHGRPIPAAEGIKLANSGLTVVVIGGDGDQFGEGMSHWQHAARRNANITLIVHNNQIYGLTTGQFSPETETGDKNKAAPVRVIEPPVNSLSTSLAAGATFVARGFAGDAKLEQQLIVEAIRHKGFSIVDSMQPCVTFNQHNTYSWFYERVYNLAEEKHDTKNKLRAFEIAEQWPLKRMPLPEDKERVAVGILYEENRLTWEEGFPQIAETPLVKQNIEKVDISPILDEMK